MSLNLFCASHRDVGLCFNCNQSQNNLFLLIETRVEVSRALNLLFSADSNHFGQRKKKTIILVKMQFIKLVTVLEQHFIIGLDKKV
jgi:hypothetical protein